MSLTGTTEPAASKGLLRGENLDVWRADKCLFESLDFELGAGRLALLVGPNGAGKTTLLRVLAGLMPPTAGRVTFGGTNIRALPPERRAEIAYRGHFDGIKGELSVEENLELCRRLWNGSANLEPLLEELHLTEKRGLRVRYLSAGQRRRVALACLRLCGARLWLLDEPTTNLDADGRTIMRNWIRGHVEEGGTAVVATHQPDELAAAGALMIEL